MSSRYIYKCLCSNCLSIGIRSATACTLGYCPPSTLPLCCRVSERRTQLMAEEAGEGAIAGSQVRKQVALCLPLPGVRQKKCFSWLVTMKVHPFPVPAREFFVQQEALHNCGVCMMRVSFSSLIIQTTKPAVNILPPHLLLDRSCHCLSSCPCP